MKFEPAASGTEEHGGNGDEEGEEDQDCISNGGYRVRVMLAHCYTFFPDQQYNE